ncbi:MAG: hypothetical protein KY429_09485 [Actinobacteria bacterium]|nr:hypothetical protein [Actinomycetota bacterium]
MATDDVAGSVDDDPIPRPTLTEAGPVRESKVMELSAEPTAGDDSAAGLAVGIASRAMMDANAVNKLLVCFRLDLLAIRSLIGELGSAIWEGSTQ